MPVTTLKKTPIFRNLSDRNIRAIARLSSIETFSKNTAILRESQKAVTGDFYIIRKGRVKVSRIGTQGREIIFTELKAGDSFGEMAIIDRQPRSANVITLSDTEMVVIKGPDFLKILKAYPAIALNLLKIMSRRIRRSDTQIKSLSLMNSVGRIATALTQIADIYGKKKKGALEISSPPPLKEIAALSSTSAATVSRALRSFSLSGFVKRVGKKLVIHDYDNFKKLYC